MRWSTFPLHCYLQPLRIQIKTTDLSLQCRVECQTGRVGSNPILNRSDQTDVVTRSIWKLVEWQLHYNSIDLKSVGLQQTGTIYRSNQIHLRTGIWLNRRTLLIWMILRHGLIVFYWIKWLPAESNLIKIYVKLHSFIILKFKWNWREGFSTIEMVSYELCPNVINLAW